MKTTRTYYHAQQLSYHESGRFLWPDDLQGRLLPSRCTWPCIWDWETS